MAAQLCLDVVVQSREQAEMLLGVQLVRPLRVWLKLDSGMHRLGFSADELRDWHARLCGAEQVEELNLVSHFACADLPGHPLNQAQLESYRSLDTLVFANRSLANSAAILTLPEAHLDWLRPGIMLYGASPFAERTAAELGLRPAMTLSGALIAVREVAVGESVGYGASWVAERPTRIGTISCGYADGYPRTAPAGTPVLVGGQRAPLVGRVSMDMLTVDLSAVPAAQVGTPVELWGAQLPVDEVASACGTIGYELLSKLTARVPRRHRY
jgi:alanine racemase